MSLISTLIEPHRVTRVFFDCRAVVPNPAELLHIHTAQKHGLEHHDVLVELFRGEPFVPLPLASSHSWPTHVRTYRGSSDQQPT